jgi:hypothetical protein
MTAGWFTHPRENIAMSTTHEESCVDEQLPINQISSHDARNVASYVHNIQLSPVFYDVGQKAIHRKDWHTSAPLSLDEIASSNPQSNVGIHLRDGVTDIDLDCPESLAIADQFLPPTGFTFGRISTPRSHRLYRSSVAQSKRYLDPVSKKMLLEVRTGGPENGGVQSLCWGVQPDGEPVGISGWEVPARIDPERLLQAAGACAATAMLARHFDGGDRHDTGLALCAWLLSVGLNDIFVDRIIWGIATACRDPKPETLSRLESQLAATRGKRGSGEPVLGRASLIKEGHLDEKVVVKAEEWLGVKPAYDARTFTWITDDEDFCIPPKETNSYLGNGVISKGGIVLCAGPMNSAKTLYWTCGAYHLATGRNFQGFLVKRPYRVLYLLAEGNRAVYADRRRQVKEATGIAEEVPNLMFLSRECHMPKISELRQLIQDSRAEIVILDTVGYFHDGDENSNTDIKNLVMKPLRELAREFPWEPAFVIVHHFVKRSEGYTGAAKSRGASALSDDASTVMTFEVKGDNRTIVQSFEKVKDGPPVSPRTLRIDYDRAQIELLDGADAARAAEPRLEEVANLVPVGTSIRAKDLVSRVEHELKVKTTIAKRLVAESVKSGLIERPERGLYMRPTTHPVEGSESVN